MEMAKLYDKLNLIFLLWFVGNLCCVAGVDKAYNACTTPNLEVSPKLKDTGLIRVQPSRKLPGSQGQCKIHFRLCKSCRLWLSVKNSNLKNNNMCYPRISSYCIEDCNYLRVVDEIYNSTHAFFFRPGNEFTSVSNTVSVTLCNSYTDIGFEVSFRVEGKKMRIYPPRTETFKSPGFPGGYSMNGEEFMYEIIKPFHAQDMLVTFTDWIISPRSKLTVYSGRAPMTFTGNDYRPVFVSRVSIQLTFSTGINQTDFSKRNPNIFQGFKAVIECRPDFSHHSIPHPTQMCGPGLIRMKYRGVLRFTPEFNIIYDCVWVIVMNPEFKKVAVQLEVFRTSREVFRTSNSTTIKLYEGLTSEGRLIETAYPGHTFTYEYSNGFYIRLQGRMNKGDLFAMAYSNSMLTVEPCPFGFKCKNGFCIHMSFECDGINNCLDKSDETECYKDNRPNPHEPITSNWSVSIIIPVVITIFIFIILCLFFIFVRRFRKISRGSDAHRQTRVASIGGSISQQFNQNHFSMNLTLEGELDAPPSYEEVINSPPPRGNWNLAFNWSQPDLRDTPAPPPYSEYMRENGVNLINGITDNDISDISTIPTDTSSSNNCTDPTSEDQNSTSGSGSDTVYSETPPDMDQWMVDRSTSTSEEGMELDMDNNKMAAGEPVVRTQVVQELNTQTQADQNNCNFSLSGADSNKSSPADLDPIAKVDPKNNNIGYRNLSADGQFLRPSRSRSMDSESNSSYDIPHCGQNNTVQNPGEKNSSSGRRNSYPSVIFLTDKQLNNEVFV